MNAECRVSIGEILSFAGMIVTFTGLGIVFGDNSRQIQDIGEVCVAGGSLFMIVGILGMIFEIAEDRTR